MKRMRLEEVNGKCHPNKMGHPESSLLKAIDQVSVENMSFEQSVVKKCY